MEMSKQGETRTFKNGHYCNTVREDGSVYIEGSMISESNGKSVIEKLGVSSYPWNNCWGSIYSEKSQKEICCVNSESIKDNDMATSYANAQLIATAPEMLKFLIALAEGLDKMSKNGLEKDSELCTLIEKACYPKTWKQIKELTK